MTVSSSRGWETSWQSSGDVRIPDTPVWQLKPQSTHIGEMQPLDTQIEDVRPFGSQAEKMGQSDTQVVELRPLALRWKKRDIVTVRERRWQLPDAQVRYMPPAGCSVEGDVTS